MTTSFEIDYSTANRLFNWMKAFPDIFTKMSFINPEISRAGDICLTYTDNESSYPSIKILTNNFDTHYHSLLLNVYLLSTLLQTISFIRDSYTNREVFMGLFDADYGIGPRTRSYGVVLYRTFKSNKACTCCTGCSQLLGSVHTLKA